MENCEPFFFERGDIGCLLIHGFSGSPPEMRLLGEYLAAKDITVSGVRLAGHGTTPEEFAQTRWEDWVQSADMAAAELKKRCRVVFCGGLSMGGAITFYLCLRHSFEGIMCLSAPANIQDFKFRLVPFAARFIKFITMPEDNDLSDKEAIKHVRCYKRLPLACVKSFYEFHQLSKKEIPSVTTPILVMHGLKDRALSPENAKYLYTHVGSKDKKIVLLENSGHAITVDAEREKVFQECHAFILGHLPRKPENV